MITLFALPKSFVGHIDIIQRNAINSWKLLQPQCEIIIFGDEKGTSDVAKEFNVLHIPKIKKNEYNTPVVNDLFEKARQLAKYNFLCYVNSDIIFFNDLLLAINKVSQWKDDFLIVGQCLNLDIMEPQDFKDPRWKDRLLNLAAESGKSRGHLAADFFIFPRPLYKGTIPPFALGRGYFDNWLIWKARDLKVPVVDISQEIKIIHQNHDYSHIRGGQQEAYYGEEAKRNVALTGGLSHRRTILDATHCLSKNGITRNLINKFRWEMIKLLKTRVRYSILDKTRPFRHKIGLYTKI